jgi:hypothetical protein
MSSNNSFRSKSYWKTFNESRSSFEWYGSFEQIAPNLIHFAHILENNASQTSNTILVPGCGNSDLSEKLVDAGLAASNIVSVDFDGTVINTMKTRTRTLYPEMVWLEGDVRDFSSDFFKKHDTSSSFSTILDKGLLDAMLSSTEDSSKTKSSSVKTTEVILSDAKKMMNACWNLLEPTGTHVIVSLLEEHVLRFIIDYALSINNETKNNEWKCQVDISVFAGNGGSDLTSPLCPFFISLTKVAKAETSLLKFIVHEPTNYTATVNKESSTSSTTSSTISSLSSSSSSSSIPTSTQSIRGSTYVIGSRTISTGKQSIRKISDTFNEAKKEILEFLKNDKAIEFNFAELSGREHDVIFSIQNIQWQHYVKHRLQTITGETYLEMDLWPQAAPSQGKAEIGFATLSGVPVDSIASNGVPTRPRYNVTIVDGIKSENVISSSSSKRPLSKARCAVLLIPQGREHEFSFAVKEGQLALARQADVDRLIFVSMCRGHLYASLQVVQQELSPAILTMVPKECALDKNIPFLAVADDIGSRFIVAEGSSKLSGSYTVEDVPEEYDNESERTSRKILRRLVFMSNRNAIQSEVLLLTSPDGTCTGVDKQSLQFPYHQTMAASVCYSLPLNDNSSDIAHRIMIIGLGGGGLATFLAHSGLVRQSGWGHKGAVVSAVELDPDIVRVASTHFGCDIDGEPLLLESLLDTTKSDNTKYDILGNGKVSVIIGDGLDCIQGIANSSLSIPKPHVILIDVDAKDMRTGLSFPPVSFVSRAFLKSIHTALAPGGIMILNLGARSKPLFIGSLTAIQNEFGIGNVITIHSNSDDGSESSESSDLNCVVVACTDTEKAKDHKGAIERATKMFGKNIGETLLSAKIF